MNSSVRREVEDIKREIQGIINELEDIALGLRKDFKNIGNERCSTNLYQMADQYRKVKTKLDNI